MPDMTLTKRESLATSASNALYRDEVTDFRAAMRLIMQGMRAEIRDTQLWKGSLGPDEQQYRWSADIYEHYHAAAEEALRIYNEEVTAAEERVATRLRALVTSHETADYERIADALETNLFSELAW